MKVSVSVLSSTYKVNDLVKKLNDTDADYLHLDIMDGKFTENKSWTTNEVIKFTNLTSKKLDVHMMVKDPLKYLNDYAMLNTEYYTFHIEAVKDAKKVIDEIKMLGLKPGIAISPDTNLDTINDLLDDVKLVNIMTVIPGKSGQKFMESTLYKIEALKRIKEERNLDIIIEVDGGINNETISLVKDYVDMVVSASYLHNEKYMQDGINVLRE